MRRSWMLVLLLAGCSSSRLEPLLSAPDAQTFDRQLKIHGPIEDGEVATLEREARGPDARRARNAVSLLTLSRQAGATQSVLGLGSSTNDLELWSTATASALLREKLEQGAVPAGLLRPDMARQGLKSADLKTYRIAFQVAGRLKLPELQAELPKALESTDSETRALAIRALSPQQAQSHLAELRAELKTADYATFPPLAIALINSGEPAAWQAVVDSYLKDHERDSAQTSFLNEVNFNMTPQIYAFMVDRAKRSDEFAREAFSSLVFQVIQENKHCDHALMALALPRLREAARTKKRDDDPEMLVTVVAQGGNPSKTLPDFEKRMHGPQAQAFAEQWLKDHPVSEPGK
ncbi:MAG: hypothetical protein U0931_16385 [Vulcanimicrobiota bacterium]